jgi:large subunit ribosomal protein L6
MENIVVKIPEGVKVELANGTLTATGKAGKNHRAFDIRKLKIEVKGAEVHVEGDSLTMVNTAQAHIKNILNGALGGYTFKMQAIHSHFPVSFEVKGKEFFIKNFLGEKKPRISAIVADTKLVVKGTDVHISGPSKDDVGQTMANIKTALRIRKRDSRIFQDGLYVVEE